LVAEKVIAVSWENVNLRLVISYLGDSEADPGRGNPDAHKPEPILS
jgi:hypothetical protein